MKTRNFFSFFFGALLSQTSLAGTDYQPYVFSTLAGNTGEGTQDGIGSEARFSGRKASGSMERETFS